MSISAIKEMEPIDRPVVEGAFRAYTLDHDKVVGLVEAIRSGDEQAWGDLIDTFSGLLRATAVNVNLSGDDIEDASQETLIKLFRHIDTIEEPERLGGWLKTTAMREGFRIREKRDRHLPVGGTNSTYFHDTSAHYSDVVDPDSDLGERNLAAQDDAEAVRELLKHTTQEERDFLDLLFRDKKPNYTRIVDELDLAIGSIGSKRKRLLQRLQKRAEELGLAADIL